MNALLPNAYKASLQRARPLSRCLLTLLSLIFLAAMLLSCSSQQSKPPDPRLKYFKIESARILILDTQAEVDGTIFNSGPTQYPFDVSLTATFYDSSNHVVGSAQGVAEDVWKGTTRPFILYGTVNSETYTHMVVVPVSLRERTYEKFLPSPPPVVP